MGPLTGMRLVNLRVRDKVAYPDVTIDLSGHDHVVIGLENGGGKSTLLSFIQHVFVPHAEMFLARRAQRRQKKEGREKRIEHYVPGGAPTHVIVELELPERQGRLGGSPRVLVGACLHKEADAKADVKADEFFWSAHCVTDELTLDSLPLRSDRRRLWDHNEWRSWLDDKRTAVPAAQIVVHTRQGAWEQHLRDDLRIDVDFVRSFLTLMNEDEGAADHVFTYASSRAFLNSLVKAVANPATIDNLKKSLVGMRSDADGIRTDRRRERLLRDLITCTEPLAESAAELAHLSDRRTQFVDAVLAADVRTRTTMDLADKAASEASSERDRLEREARAADSRSRDTAAIETLARRQLAALELESSQNGLAKACTDADASRSRERTVAAAALLVALRNEQSAAEEVVRALESRRDDAEPLRSSAASATLAWLDLLNSAVGRVDKEIHQSEVDVTAAESVASAAADARTKTAGEIARFEEQIRQIDEEIARVDAKRDAAVRDGLLDDGQPLDDAAEAARGEVKRFRSEREQASAAAEAAQNELMQLSEKRTGLEVEATTLSIRRQDAQEAEESARNAAENLAAELGASGLIDLAPIVLDTQADAIRETLAAVITATRDAQIGAVVSAAEARRVTVAIDEGGLLPPRSDIEVLCARARKQRLGVRSGWTYLAQLPADIAQRYATTHPALADGIVVNIPGDLAATVELLRDARDHLTGPVVVAGPDAFESDATLSGEVVLPDPGFWSRDAAGSQLNARNDAQRQAERQAEECGERIEVAIKLDQQVRDWSMRFGAGSIEAAHAESEMLATQLREIATQIHEIDEERERLKRDRQAATDVVADLVRQLEAATERAVVLERLNGDAVRVSMLDDQREPLVEGRETAVSYQRDTEEEFARQTQAAKTARDRGEQLRSDRRDLGFDVAEAKSIAIQVAHDNDTIDHDVADVDHQQAKAAAQTRYATWRGSISDPELEARLETHRQQVAEIDRKLTDEFEAKYRTLAHSVLEEDSSYTAADFNREKQRAREETDRLVHVVGRFEVEVEQRQKTLNEIEAETRRQRRAAQLEDAYITEDLERARVVAEEFGNARATALIARQSAEEQARLAVEEAVRTDRVHQALREIVRELARALQVLAAAGPVMELLDLTDREHSLDVSAALLDGPDAAAQLVTHLDNSAEKENLAVLQEAVNELTEAADALRRNLSEVETQTTGRLDAVEAVLRDADETIVAGDQLLQLLRRSGRRELLDRVTEYHRSASERHAVVSDHVAKFADRLAALAAEAYATIETLRREVNRTVRDSTLPETPTLGRWGGLPLLKLGGISTLTMEQRQTAIHTKLQEWFDPDAKSRPDFDADATIWALLEVTTPRLTAKVLIPSDPLDPDHKPVDELALETSGGEGVTFALMLASLLASRRAANNGHASTTIPLDNPFAKLTKPTWLRLARDVATAMHVRLVLLTGMKDLGALSVFPALIQLRVSRRKNANVVAPVGIDDERLTHLVRDGTLYVSAVEWSAAASTSGWPTMSAVEISTDKPDAGIIVPSTDNEMSSDGEPKRIAE